MFAPVIRKVVGHPMRSREISAFTGSELTAILPIREHVKIPFGCCGSESTIESKTRTATIPSASFVGSLVRRKEFCTSRPVISSRRSALTFDRMLRSRQAIDRGESAIARLRANVLKGL